MRIKRLFAMIMAGTLILSVSPTNTFASTVEMTESDTNAVKAESDLNSATWLSLNTRTYGNLNEEKDKYIYKFTLNSASKLNIEAIAQMYDVSYKILDQNGNQLYNKYAYWDSTTKQSFSNINIYLTRGEFYFVVERYGSDGSFNLRMSATAVSESFIESEGGSNNTLDTASNIFTGNEYYGQIAADDTVDFYKFALTHSGRIEISGSISDMKMAMLKLYNKNGEEIDSGYLYANSTTNLITLDKTYDLTAGTYYFSISSAYEGIEYLGAYSFRMNFTDANESFSESDSSSNNSLEKANLISMNTTYQGQIAYNDKADFYRFALNNDDTINISSIANIHGVIYCIYGSDGKNVMSDSKYWDDSSKRSTFTKQIELTKGTYYFAVERTEGYTGNYSFSIGSSKSNTENLTDNYTYTDNSKNTPKNSDTYTDDRTTRNNDNQVIRNNMYRLYNPNSGEHFYTEDMKERNHLIRVGWRDEGVAWVSPSRGEPVYRLYNPNAGDHHYTKEDRERRALVKAGWRYEGIGWYSGGNQPVYRQYNPNAKTGTHNYTPNVKENNYLVGLGWRYEGISWYSL